MLSTKSLTFSFVEPEAEPDPDNVGRGSAPRLLVDDLMLIHLHAGVIPLNMTMIMMIKLTINIIDHVVFRSTPGLLVDDLLLILLHLGVVSLYRYDNVNDQYH